MRSFRSKPTGWKNDTYRHYLAGKYGSAGGNKYNVSKESIHYVNGVKVKLYDVEDPEMATKDIDVSQQKVVWKRPGIGERHVYQIRDADEEGADLNQIGILNVQDPGVDVLISNNPNARKGKDSAMKLSSEGKSRVPWVVDKENLYGRAESEFVRRLLNEERYEEAKLKVKR